MGRIQSIQVLRAVAAISVVAYHCLNRWEDSRRHWESSGWHIGAIGVDLFFVISGFIMTRLALRGPSAATFFKNRFQRVAPLYWIHSLPWLILAIVAGDALGPPAIATGLFWPAVGHRMTYPFSPVGWTLCFEALFYTAVATALALGARAWALLGAVFVLAFGLACSGYGPVFQFLGNPLLLEFGLGAIIALRPIKARPKLALAALTLAVALILFWAAHGIGWTHDGNRFWNVPLMLARVFMFAPPSVLIVWGALQLETWATGRIAKALAYLGDASYSLYLIHPLTVLGLAAFWKSVSAPVGLLPFAAFCAAICSGIAAYERIEKPLMSALRQPRARPVPAE